MLKAKQVMLLLLVSWLYQPTAQAAAPVQSANDMVTTEQHLASEVGRQILAKGGNAIDAAVAIGYTLAVTLPCCGNLGGGGFMLIHLANGENAFLDFREVAPAGIRQQHFLTAAGEVDTDKLGYGFLPVGVPGTVLGLNTALKRYGTLPLKTLMAPAINYAEHGFKLSRYEADQIQNAGAALSKQPEAHAIFFKHGKYYRAGDNFKQINLAHSLKQISEHGSKAFYNGWIRDHIVAASEHEGGVLTKDDFNNYQVKWREPVQCQYRGYSILSAAPPSSGGTTICQSLNILSHFDLKSAGFHSADSIHYLAEALRFAFVDRNFSLGDPEFIKNPVQQLVSLDYAEKIANRINPKQATASTQLTSNKADRESQNTTHYSVVDHEGNAVAVTYTLDYLFGAKVVASNTGILMNNELHDFTIKSDTANEYGLVQGDNNLIQPNTRPLSSMSPTIVLRDNKPFMVLGAAGGSTIITTVLQAIINVIDYGMNIQQAIDAPRIHMQWLPDTIFNEPYAINPDTYKILKQRQHHLTPGSPWGTTTWGAAEAILQDKEGLLFGANDSRRPAGLATGN